MEELRAPGQPCAGGLCGERKRRVHVVMRRMGRDGWLRGGEGAAEKEERGRGKSASEPERRKEKQMKSDTLIQTASSA